MRRLDRAVVAVLAVVLVALGATLALPRPAPSPAPTAAPSGGPVMTDAPPVVYREGVVGQPGSITPITARTASARTLVGLIFSGLVKLGPDNTFVPDLASDWQVGTGGQIWTFHIRPDAAWQDGAPVTADDVAFTVDALKTADASGVEAAAWAEVEVDAVDTKTVEFTLGSPVAGFLAALTQPLLPKHLLDGHPISGLGSGPFARQPVGSGPWMLSSLDDTMAVLVPSPAVLTPTPSDAPSGLSSGAPSDAPSGVPSGGAGPGASGSPGVSASPGAAVPGGGVITAAATLPIPSRTPTPSATPKASGTPGPSGSARPSGSPGPSGSAGASPSASPTPVPTPTPVPAGAKIDKIEIHFYDNQSDLADAFRSGAIDAASGLLQADVAGLAALPGAQRLRYPTTALTTVLLNLMPAQPAFRDATIRRALLEAIDRNALASSLLGGDAVRADALVPPTSWAFDATVSPQVAFDTAAAIAALKKAGWTFVGGAWTAPKAKTPFTIEILTVPPASNTRLAKIAGFVRDAWTSLGFTVNLVEVDASELSTRLHDSNFTAAVVDIAMGVEPDLYSLLASSQTRSTGANLSGYQDAALDTLLEAARAPAASPEKQKAAWTALEKSLAASMPLLPLVWHDDVVVVRGVNGITPRLIAGPGDRYWDVLSWRLAGAG